MEDKVISLETGKLALEKGFKIYCNEWYIETKEHYYEDYHTGNEYLSEYTPPRICSIAFLNDNNVAICPAPTQSLLQKWVRDYYHLHISIGYELHMKWFFQIDIAPYTADDDLEIASNNQYNNDNFLSYEAALEVGLQQALTLIP